MSPRLYPAGPETRPNGPFPGSRTYPSAIAAPASLVASVGTSTSTVSHVLLAAAALIDLPQLVTVTTAVSTGAYKTGSSYPVAVTGVTARGAVLSDLLYLTQANGGETVQGAVPFVSVTSVVTVGQNNALGSWTFGVGDVVLPQPCAAVRVKLAGTVDVAYADGHADSLDFAAAERQPVLAVSVKATSTGYPITVYL